MGKRFISVKTLNLIERGNSGVKMSENLGVRELELNDNFTDGEDPAIPVAPGNYTELIDDWAVGNYQEEGFKVTLQIVNGKKLIGIHNA